VILFGGFKVGQVCVRLLTLCKEASHSLGAVEANEVMIFDKLMGPESLFLTGNS